jgi:hypothetical protein
MKSQLLKTAERIIIVELIPHCENKEWGDDCIARLAELKKLESVEDEEHFTYLVAQLLIRSMFLVPLWKNLDNGVYKLNALIPKLAHEGVLPILVSMAGIICMLQEYAKAQPELIKQMQTRARQLALDIMHKNYAPITKTIH